MRRTPRAALLVALTLPCLTTARSMLNASVPLRANAAALGLDVLVDPVPVPAANKTFWSIDYPEDYFDPQCRRETSHGHRGLRMRLQRAWRHAGVHREPGTE